MGRGTSTCWTMIRGASAGRSDDRTHFVGTYTPVIRSYLLARWRGSPLLQDVDDAVQEVFLACFREGGAIEQADDGFPGGFRPFLYAVVRNVARHVETKRKRRRESPLHSSAADLLEDPRERSLATAFDRAWAIAVMREAAALQERRATGIDEDATRRVKLLRLRFQDDLPIREIARRWEMDATHVHRAYARARREFERCLIDVMRFHQPDRPGRATAEARQLLALLAD